MSVLELVINLPFLAHEINDAQRQIEYHGRSMLLEAKRAGEALLRAKKMVPHGHFKAWVEENCRCSYSQAARYMKVAKNLGGKTFDSAALDLSIDAFLGYEKPTPEAQAFTREDAEYVLKIAALAERGATEGERDVATSKLKKIAATFSMDQQEMVARAKALLPANEETAEQMQMEAARSRLAELEAKLSVFTRIEQEAVAEYGPEAGAEIGRLRCRLEELGDDWRNLG